MENPEETQSIADANSDQGKKHVHYVIVVHGIGEQRPNETLIPVINRFANVRQADLEKEKIKWVRWKDRISLGKLSSQLKDKDRNDVNRSWVQMRGIPEKKPPKEGNESDSAIFFNGEISSGTADIRFVDMHWADILDKHHGESGQGVESWTDTVIARLIEKEKKKFIASQNKEDRLDNWVISILEQVQETSLFAKKVAVLPWVGKGKEVNDILNKYVGDIQVYGENSSVRGEAVARFHETMDNLAAHHKHEHEDENSVPKYTIIAHSLGTVMAMDALFYAHVKQRNGLALHFEEEESEESVGRPNVPFAGFNNKELVKRVQKDGYDENEVMGSEWIYNVESFVTLGSPIDKYLTLWGNNYNYLGNRVQKQEEQDSKKSKEEIKKPSANLDHFKIDLDRSRISHFNYCDEQDPVGHYLDKLRGREGYQWLFQSDDTQDVVYNRYKLPGVAHVKYWKDKELFREIMDRTVDRGTPIHEEIKLKTRFRSGVVSAISLFMTYLVPTLLFSIILASLFLWSYEDSKGEFQLVEKEKVDLDQQFQHEDADPTIIWQGKDTMNPVANNYADGQELLPGSTIIFSLDTSAPLLRKELPAYDEEVKRETAGIRKKAISMGKEKHFESILLVSWKSALIGTFLFCLAVYFCKKMLSLFVWWRQLLRLKREKRYSKLQKRLESGKIFSIQLVALSILLILGILSSVLIAQAIIYPFEAEEARSYSSIFAAFIGGAAIVIMIISRLVWGRSWNGSVRKYHPEILTLLFAGCMALLVNSLMKSDLKSYFEEDELSLVDSTAIDSLQLSDQKNTKDSLIPSNFTQQMDQGNITAIGNKPKSAHDKGLEEYTKTEITMEDLWAAKERSQEHISFVFGEPRSSGPFSRRWLPKTAVFLTALTICWAYVLFSVLTIRPKLKRKVSLSAFGMSKRQILWKKLRKKLSFIRI